MMYRSALVLPLVTLAGFMGSACGSGDDAPEGVGASAGSSGESGGVGGGANVGGRAGSADDGGAAGSGGAGAGAGGTPTTAGAAGQGGHGGAPFVLGPPVVESMTPAQGPYGGIVTITGTFLGSSSRAGVQLRIGNTPAFVIQANGDSFVESWSEDEIRFRYPFPATGEITLETPQGVTSVGDYESSWVSTSVAANAPAASVLASISAAPQTVTLLFDGTPPVLLELGPGGAVTHAVTLNGAVPSSVRLYLAGSAVEGIGVTDGDDPELIHLQNVDGDLVGEATGIVLDATETALAGGPDGACAWLHRAGGWVRARPVGDDWAIDTATIPDVESTAPDRAVGATSDGSLYVAWSVETGNFLDDMEAPRMRRLDSSALTWSTAQNAGSNVDDYITSLEILDKGRGVVVRYCGSDTDPWGVSGTAYRCYDGLHTPAGASIARVSVDVTASRHAFSASRAIAGYCDDAETFRLRTDTDVASEPNGPVGEAIVYPCQTTTALELDPNGDFVPVVRRGTLLYMLGRREAP